MRLECRKKPVPPAATFKLIRRFLSGTSPFFLLFSAAPFLFFFGTPPLFVRTANRVVGVSTDRYRANEIPIVEHRGIKSLHAAGDVPAHLHQVIRNRAVYPFNVVDLDKGGVVKTTRNFSTKNRQRVRIVIKFILVFQSTRPTNRSDFSRTGFSANAKSIFAFIDLILTSVEQMKSRRNKINSRCACRFALKIPTSSSD